MRLAEKIRRRESRVAVVGLGRVGLPLALSFASRGLRVVGVEKKSGAPGKNPEGGKPLHGGRNGEAPAGGNKER